MSKIKFKYVCAGVGLIILLDVFGAFTHIFEVSYNDNFVWPYHGDIQPFVEALRHNKKPDVEPINEYNYSFIHELKDKCADPDYKTLRIVFLVKSAVEHFHRREGIRNSWGFGKRFFDVPTRTIFLLGTHPENSDLRYKVNAEAEKYGDIVQADFVDSYYNNTIKTMLGFKWAVKHCANSKFYMFVDDDIYISVKNVLRFIRNPTYYPDYLKEPSRLAARKKREINESSNTISLNEEPVTAVAKKDDKNSVHENPMVTSISKRATAKEKIIMRRRPGWSSHNKTRMPNDVAKEENEDKNLSHTLKIYENATHPKNTITRGRRQIFDFELPDDVRLFAGYVFVSSPHRHRTSKWYVSLKEYPYHLWPPYVTAGAYVLSKEALIDMYYTSLYTKHFKFDDIFLGLVAKKADVEPFHCDEFHFYKKDYTKFNYKYVITSHGYDDPNELVQVWQEQKSLGNA